MADSRIDILINLRAQNAATADLQSVRSGLLGIKDANEQVGASLAKQQQAQAYVNRYGPYAGSAYAERVQGPPAPATPEAINARKAQLLSQELTLTEQLIAAEKRLAAAQLALYTTRPNYKEVVIPARVTFVPKDNIVSATTEYLEKKTGPRRSVVRDPGETKRLIEQELGPQPPSYQPPPGFVGTSAEYSAGNFTELLAKQEAATAASEEKKTASKTKQTEARIKQSDREAQAEERAAQRAAAAEKRERIAVLDAGLKAAHEREQAQRVYDSAPQKQYESDEKEAYTIQRSIQRHEQKQARIQQIAYEQVQTAALAENAKIDAQEKAAQAGYVLADKEVTREQQTKKREQETILQAEIKGATAREQVHQASLSKAHDAAVKENIEFDRNLYLQTDVSHPEYKQRRIAASDTFKTVRQFEGWEGDQRARAAMGAEGSSAGGIRGFFSNMAARINRQGALEAQAMVINSAQALASGMSPLHVATMEAPQLAGAVVQGGLLSLSTIFSAMVSPIGLVVTGLTAAAAATIAWSVSIARANAALAGLQNLAALQGRGGGAGENIRGETTAMADQIRLSGFLGREDSRNTAIAVKSIPNVSPETQASLGRSAEALGRLKFGGDQEEANKFIQATFADPSKTKAFADEMGLIKGAARDTFVASAGIGNNFATSAAAAKALEERLKPVIDAQKAGREKEGWFGRNIDILGYRSQAELARQTGTYSWASIYQTPAFKPGTARDPEAVETGNLVADRELKAQKEINELLEERKTLLAGIAAAPDETKREQFKTALTVTNERLAATNTPQQEIERGRNLANLELQVVKAKEIADKDISQGYRVVAAQAAVTDAKIKYRTSEAAAAAGIAAQQTDKEIQERERDRQSALSVARDLLAIKLQQSANQRATLTPGDVTGQRLAAERELALIEAQPAGVQKESDKLNKQREIIELRRQERLEAENVTIAQLRQNEAIATAKDELGEVLRLQQQAGQVVMSSPDRQLTEKINEQTRAIERQTDARRKAVDIQKQLTESDNQFVENRLRTNTSAINLRIEQGKTTPVLAMQQELALTNQASEAQERNIQKLLANNNLFLQDRVELNEKLASLYEQDAQKQLEIQNRLTQAIREQNERRLQYIKNSFADIGSAAQDLLIAGLNKTSTLQDALKTFKNSIVSSLTKNATDMASQWAGKALAPSLGVSFKEGEDTGLSSLFSKVIGNVTGLAKPIPDTMGTAADKMKLAADAHKTAADLWQQVANKLLNQANAGVGRIEANGTGQATTLSQLDRGGGGTVTGSYTAGEPTASDPRGMVPVIRAAAEKYGHDPDVAVRVARSEGLGTFLGDHGKSGGAFQLYTGGGMGNDFQRDMKLDPLDPKNEAATIDYAMKNLGKEGWKPWHGAPKAGVSQWQGVNTGTPKSTSTVYAPDMEDYKPQKVVQQAVADAPKVTAGSGSSTAPEQAPASAGGDTTTSNQTVSTQYYTGSPLSSPQAPTSTYFLNNLEDMRDAGKTEQVAKQAQVALPRSVAYAPDMEDYVKPVKYTGMPDINTINTGPGAKGPRGMDYIFGKNIPRPEVDAGGNITKYGVDPKQEAADRVPIKVDPASVAQGVTQGQQQATAGVRTAVQEGAIQGQQSLVQGDLRNSETVTANSQQTTDNTTTIKVLDQTIKDWKPGQQTGPGVVGTGTGTGTGTEATTGLPSGAGTGTGANASVDGITKTASAASNGLSLFSSATAIASSAALLFGKNLSPTGKAVLGGVSLASNLLSFGTKAASLFAAPATGGLSLAGLFGERGMVVPSAAGGMVVPDMVPSAAGGMLAGRGGLDGRGGQISILHPREMVLPARLSDGIQNVISSGMSSADNRISSTSASSNSTINYSPQITGYHPYRSKSDFQGMLRSHGRELVRYAETVARNGYSPSRSM